MDLHFGWGRLAETDAGDQIPLRSRPGVLARSEQARGPGALAGGGSAGGQGRDKIFGRLQEGVGPTGNQHGTAPFLV